MTTNINIGIEGSLLLQQNRDAQLSNRQSNVQRDADKAFAEDVKTIEAAAQRAAATVLDRAVPEYGIAEQTSAQRGVGFGVGWMYESYENVIEQTYITDNKNKYRVAVGSGDGSKWEYVDLEIEPPDNARDYFLGSSDAGTRTFTWTVELTSTQGGVIYLECVGEPVPEASLTRHFRYEDYYTPKDPRSGCFLIPIDNARALLVGSICWHWDITRTVVIDSETVNLTPGYTFGGVNNAFILGPSGPKTYVSPQTGETFIIDASCQYARTSGSWEGGTYNPPEAYLLDHKTERLDYAFIVSADSVKRIEVSAGLQELLQDIFQPPEPSDFFIGYEFSDWPYADMNNYAAVGLGFNVSNNWGSFIAGAPSVFDIFDNDNNFNYFRDAETTISAYLSNPPRISPDSILEPADSLDRVITDVYSAFYYGAKLQTAPVVPRPTFVSEAAYINEYVYLKPEERSISDYYTYSSSGAKDVLATLPANPRLFFMRIDNPPDGISTENDGYNIRWLPTEGFRRTKENVALSGARLLPPALFSPQLTPHPLIKKQPTSYANAFVYSPSPYSRFKMTTLFWTAWNRNWTSKLAQLGISLAPYTTTP